jgi:alpha-D-xyloside xylohydrolase
MSTYSVATLPEMGVPARPRVGLDAVAVSGGWVAVAPGVWSLTLGAPEAITPVSVRRSRPASERWAALPEAPASPPFAAEAIAFRAHARGCTVELPYDPEEGVFGLGLQLKSHLQSGKKKHLRVNADPVYDTGDSHAPAPFYASTAGYAIYADTARYLSAYIGTHAPVAKLAERVYDKWNAPPRDPSEIYRGVAIGNRVVLDIPAAPGVTLYCFAGPAMRDAVSRYVLFSGGGVLPPRWGLGNWYRACTRHSAEDVDAFLDGFDRDEMPFSVLGLEPGWHTHFYPNSFVWNETKFPRPEAFLARMHARGYRVNLWENAFVHPAAPFADAIRPYCGDQLSTDGLAPDFLHPEARRLFAEHHERLVAQGVDGFKLDECDNGDFLPFAWSFPEHTRFPSGADGEQMHCLLGVHYQHALADVFEARGTRHYDLVRSSGALAAPLSYVLYSDLYAHADFIRGVATAGYSGLLWTPEVRHADSLEDLVRRVQAVVLSPMSLINGWYIPMPPWKQLNRKRNEAGEMMPEADEATRLVREALRLRERLLPYIYTAFAHYHASGLPPFRGLPMDFPADKLTWKIDHQFMIGPDLLAAPLMAGEKTREVYLPAGYWRDFLTGERLEGGRAHAVDATRLETVPLFVREGAILPLAGRAEKKDALPKVIPHVYATDRARGELYDDDGTSHAHRRGACAWTRLEWSRAGGLRVETRGASAGFARQEIGAAVVVAR